MYWLELLPKVNIEPVVQPGGEVIESVWGIYQQCTFNIFILKDLLQCMHWCFTSCLLTSTKLEGRVPATSWMSGLLIDKTALLTILWTTSQILIRCMPGHLSRAINQHAVNGTIQWGSTKFVLTFFCHKGKAIAKVIGCFVEWGAYMLPSSCI